MPKFNFPCSERQLKHAVNGRYKKRLNTYVIACCYILGVIQLPLIWNWYCQSSPLWSWHATLATYKNQVLSIFWVIPCIKIVIIKSNERYIIMTQYWICFQWKNNIEDVTIIAIKFYSPVCTDILFPYNSSSQLGCMTWVWLSLLLGFCFVKEITRTLNISWL